MIRASRAKETALFWAVGNGPCETGRVKRAVKCTFQSGQDVSTSSYTHLYTVQSCSPWNEEFFPALRDSTKFSQSPRHFPQWERDGFRMFSVTHVKRQRLNRTDVCWSLFWCEQMHQFASKPFKCVAIKIKEALFETASRILGTGQQIADARSAHVNEQTRSRFVCSPHHFVRWEKQEGWRCCTMFYPFHVHLICFFVDGRHTFEKCCSNEVDAYLNRWFAVLFFRNQPTLMETQQMKQNRVESSEIFTAQMLFGAAGS